MAYGVETVIIEIVKYYLRIKYFAGHLPNSRCAILGATR